MTDKEFYRAIVKIDNSDLTHHDKFALSILLSSYKYMKTKGLVDFDWEVLYESYLNEVKSHIRLVSDFKYGREKFDENAD